MLFVSPFCFVELYGQVTIAAAFITIATATITQTASRKIRFIT
jgi:hypothetical protein